MSKNQTAIGWAVQNILLLLDKNKVYSCAEISLLYTLTPEMGANYKGAGLSAHPTGVRGLSSLAFKNHQIKIQISQLRIIVVFSLQWPFQQPQVSNLYNWYNYYSDTMDFETSGATIKLITDILFVFLEHISQKLTNAYYSRNCSTHQTNQNEHKALRLGIILRGYIKRCLQLPAIARKRDLITAMCIFELQMEVAQVLIQPKKPCNPLENELTNRLTNLSWLSNY